MYKLFRFFLFLTIPLFVVEARLPEIDAQRVTAKLDEVMRAHVSQKQVTPTLIRRALKNYLEELDPSKTYFVEDDIHQYLEPPDSLVERMINDYRTSNYVIFEEIHDAMVSAIARRNELEKRLEGADLPTDVEPSEFKDLEWAENEDDLYVRLLRIKALRTEATEKLSPEFRDKALQRITKHRAKREEDLLTQDPTERRQLILSNVLKAMTSAMDAHTAYFTPGEATQFMINVQQRLFGIGAQLRDDLNGFTVVKVIEGGPASRDGRMKSKDRIIGVNGEPVVGLDIIEAVDLIRGEEDTPVTLSVVREVWSGELKEQQQLDITINRGEVVLQETRLETDVEPFGDGVVAYLRLYSFYQDPESSSTKDLVQEINKLKEQYKVRGIILDLRYNSGGMLSQAVSVTGLFITKGIVVSIKNDAGQVQHLRDLDSKTVWDGPLTILINRASASAAEIVAQTLQDYGRAVIVGDDHTYGKGTFQTFTLTSNKKGTVNPEGEYKVTRGKYYTVSGKSPQLVGVSSDIVVPSLLSELDIGEKYASFPLENDSINPNFDDDLGDLPYAKRQRIRQLYKFDLQPRLSIYTKHLHTLRNNSATRIENNKNYQNFLKEIRKEQHNPDEEELYGSNDLQLIEAYNIMKDLILLLL